MRLFLLPISTRRSLIYCEKLQVHEKALADRSYLDRITNKANTTWLSWEKDEKAIWQWKRKVTFYGNQALSRIPYEEWALKTIPALTDKRKKLILAGKEKNQVIFPGLFLKEDKIPDLLKKLAVERQAMHRRKLIWSIVAMPFSAPFMLIPVIPNLPFFYLVYRAYSHWKAWSGSKHLEFLLKHSLPSPQPSWALDEIYAAGLMYPTRQISRAAPHPTKEQATEIARVVEQQTDGGKEDVMVLQRWNGKLIAEHYALPDMEVEIERAVEQVAKSIKTKEILVEEKKELERATAEPGKTAADALPAELIKHVELGEKADRVIHEKAKDVAEEGRRKKEEGEKK